MLILLLSSKEIAPEQYNIGESCFEYTFIGIEIQPCMFECYF